MHLVQAMQQLLSCIFAFFYISKKTQIATKNLITFLLYQPRSIHKISSQSVHNVLSNVTVFVLFIDTWSQILPEETSEQVEG